MFAKLLALYKNKKKLFIFLFLVFIGSAGYLGFLRNSPTLRIVLPKQKTQIVGTYKSDKYGYSFQVPESFIVTKVECEENLKVECLEKFTITPKGYSLGDLKYLNLGEISYLKGLENVGFAYGNGGPGSHYDVKTDKWVIKYPREDGYITGDMPSSIIGNNTVYHTSSGGSHGSQSVDFIYNKSTDTIFIVSTPSSKRIRCDGIENIDEAKACNSYLQQIRTEEEGWTPSTYLFDLFKDTDSILTSFQWNSPTKQSSPSPIDYSSKKIVKLISATNTGGTATFVDLGNNETKVIINLDIMSGKPNAAIYSGSCVKHGAIKYSLASVSNGLKTNSGPGKSETILKIAIDVLLSQSPLSIGISSRESRESLTWCGDLE